MSAGKGDRPRAVDGDRYRENYDEISWHGERSDCCFAHIRRGRGARDGAAFLPTCSWCGKDCAVRERGEAQP